MKNYDHLVICRECGQDLKELEQDEKIVRSGGEGPWRSHEQCNAARHALKDRLGLDHILICLETWWNSENKEDRQAIQPVIANYPAVKKRLLAGPSDGCVLL